MKALLAGWLSLASLMVLQAADWPQFLGPQRDGVSPETNLIASWPKEGPTVLWKTKLGTGWAGPVIQAGRLVQFHRLDGKEIVDCLNATNGQRHWRAEYPATYRDDFGFENGPRATPTVAGDRLYTYGANGNLNCWALASGSNHWSIDTRKAFGGDKGFFGLACSPLVEGEALVLNLGGTEGAGIVAFHKDTGKVLWKATAQEASYSSPVAASFAGRRRLLVLARDGLVALEPLSGRVLWEFPFRPRIQASVTAAVPLVIEEQIFLSASYGAGATLLRFQESKPETLWAKDDILSNHYATSVRHGAFFYGFDGRQEQRCHLRCVEIATGQPRWSREHFGAGTLIGAGAGLLILTERGELISALATPEQFTELARAQVLGSDCRAHAALANGRFYARDKSNLICLELRK